MTDKLVLLALCALLLIQHHGGAAAENVIALLLAACCAALVEWLLALRSSWSWVPVAVLPAIAVLDPTLAFAMPVITYDAARSHGATIARYAWIAPLAIALLRCADERLLLSIIALLACVGFAWGAQAGNAALLSKRLRDEQDQGRASVRNLRSRVTDLQESQAEAARVATLNERTRIARDIHDNVGHLLTRAIMQAEADRIVAEARNDSLSAKQFAEVGGSIKEAMTMIRRSVHDLDDASVDFSSWIADAARSTGRLHVELRNTVADSVSAPVARCLAAVIRESLANATRHSKADSVTVTVQDFPAFRQLVVQDNGNQASSTVGANGVEGTMFDRSTEDKRGMGLADIEARVRALDGICTWGPNATGWRVFVSIPKEDAQGGHL